MNGNFLAQILAEHVDVSRSKHGTQSLVVADHERVGVPVNECTITMKSSTKIECGISARSFRSRLVGGVHDVWDESSGAEDTALVHHNLDDSRVAHFPDFGTESEQSKRGP